MARKTKRQWLLEGRIPVDENAGIKDWTNGFHQQTAVYWEEEDTREATADEIAAFKAEEREKRRKRDEKRKEEQSYYEWKCEKLSHWQTAYQWLQEGMVPLKNAKWVLGKILDAGNCIKGSEYYYCHENDVEKNPDLANELLLQYPTNGFHYDGMPWW